MPKSNHPIYLKLLFVLLSGLILRIYGINWDGGYHLHPDERMITMVADQIQFFNRLNPYFFSYGSLPIYLLKGSAQFIDLYFSAHLSSYQNMIYVGRSLSVLFDLGTILLIYRIAEFVFKKKSISLFSSFLYAVAFFPIQNSHFFTVDILFTFLSTLLVYQLLLYSKKKSTLFIFILGITFAALFATKFTAVIFLPVILLALVIKNKFSLFSILHTLFFILISVSFAFIFMPYAFLDFSQFSRDISLQIVLGKNPYIFPYTLQYVNTLSYWYYLKNIFLWGLGPIISLLAIVGLKFSAKPIRPANRSVYIIFITFYFFYFLIIGISAVKFMRYMLPLYPCFAILAGIGLNKIFNYLNRYIYKLVIIGLFIWTLLFLTIYSRPNTRITATEWILNNIPPKSTLAVEYWDDYLPIYESENYHLNELHLYDIPDDDKKWKIINKQLQESDYIVLASNRLYVPLQRLSDCTKYRDCYPKTAAYYQKLFNNKLGFKKVVEFSIRPGFNIAGHRFEINDESADESFTVFDHPKIMIFKKM